MHIGSCIILRYRGCVNFSQSGSFQAKDAVDETILKALAFHHWRQRQSATGNVPPEAVKNFVWNTFRRTEKWWKKLYYNGLGEFMYRNGIVVSKEDLVTIECEDKACALLHDTQSYDGCLVSVGGGKDSVVSLRC